VLKRQQDEILLFCQVVRPAFARIEIAVKLMTAPHQVRRRFRQIVAIRLALPSGCHETTPEIGSELQTVSLSRSDFSEKPTRKERRAMCDGTSVPPRASKL
jgi:hypothetical protein